MPGSYLLQQDRALRGAEVWLAMLRKNIGDRLMLAPLDELIDVDRLPAEPLRQRARHGSFTRGHETDQIHLVGFHATSRSSVSKKLG